MNFWGETAARFMLRLRVSSFFQAEDGIRDWSVTGVQTYALPICFVIDKLHQLICSFFIFIWKIGINRCDKFFLFLNRLYFLYLPNYRHCDFLFPSNLLQHGLLIIICCRFAYAKISQWKFMCRDL